MSKKLRAPKGTDEANFADKLYRVDNDGTVEVPDEAASDLIKTGGFVPVEEPLPPLSGGLVRMAHADRTAAASWGGQSFAQDETGHIVVPNEAAEQLAAHGFRLVEA